MYDGIGLRTPRGSGTNGYVQKSLAFHVKPRSDMVNMKKGDVPKRNKTQDRELLEHFAKKRIRLEVHRLRKSLEKQEMDPDEIEKKCKALECELKDKDTQLIGTAIETLNTHQLNSLKNKQLAIVENAWKIPKSKKDQYRRRTGPKSQTGKKI